MGIPCPSRELCGPKPRPSEYAKGGEERSSRSHRRELLRRGSALRRSDESGEWGFGSAFSFLVVCSRDGLSVGRHGSVPWGFLQEQRGENAQEPPLRLPSSELQRNQGATKNSRRNR